MFLKINYGIIVIEKTKKKERKNEVSTMKKYLATVVKGQYAGRKGYVLANQPNEIGCVMWYSQKGEYPYRSTLKFSDLKIEKEA